MWIKKRKKSGSKAACCMIPDIRHPEKTELDRKSAGLREGGMDRSQTRAPDLQMLACSRTALITSHRVCTKQAGCVLGRFIFTNCAYIPHISTKLATQRRASKWPSTCSHDSWMCCVPGKRRACRHPQLCISSHRSLLAKLRDCHIVLQKHRDCTHLQNLPLLLSQL